MSHVLCSTHFSPWLSNRFTIDGAHCNTIVSIPRKFIVGLCVIMVEWSYRLCFKEHYITVNKLLFIVGLLCSWHSCFSHEIVWIFMFRSYQFLWLLWLSCTYLVNGKIQMCVVPIVLLFWFLLHLTNWQVLVKIPI